MDSSRSREPSVDQDSMITGSGSEAESLSSSVEMDAIINSDSSGRLDIRLSGMCFK